MEGNELTVIFINSGCSYNRATEIAADILRYGFRITFIRLGINIEAMFVFGMLSGKLNDAPSGRLF